MYFRLYPLQLVAHKLKLTITTFQDSLNYPTAAMSQMAYGSSTAYGPACGKCFNLTLLNTFLSDPPFFPDVVKSVVVKVTDLCPLSTTGWCNATTSGPNACALPFCICWTRITDH